MEAKKIEETKSELPKKQDISPSEPLPIQPPIKTEEKKESDSQKKKKKKKAKKDKEKSEKPTDIAHTEEAKKSGPSIAPEFAEEAKKTPATRQQDNSIFRILNSWKEGPYKQTVYPMVPLDEQFPDNKYSTGLVVEYKGEYSHRMSNPEAKAKEGLSEFEYNCYRKAAECHKQVRHFAQRIIRPGKSYISIVTEIENAVRRLIKADKTEAGLAFPCGCSINNCAAHFSPNPGDTKIVQKGDVVKIDFGTHFKGYLIDSAFTVAFEPEFDNLLLAGKEATMTGVKEAGIDARIDEIGEKIQEVMESHEVTIKGKTYKVKSVRNLQGHQVGHYHIHAGKCIPAIKGTKPEKMEEGEVYAIETFATTGKGYVNDDVDCSHYMKSFEPKHAPIKNTRSKFLLKLIEENFSTLAFARRWLEDMGFEK